MRVYSRMYCNWSYGGQTTLLALLLCFINHIQVTSAQNPVSITSTVLPTETFATETRASVLTTMSAHHTSTFSTALDVSNTTSSASSSATEQVPPGLFPAATHSSNVHVRDESVFNYYFLFLAAFAVLIAVFLWWLHKQRKRRKQQMRLSGHNALSRDLEGWAGARRFMHGRYGRNEAAFARREEGLDEHGEAPPPYQPKNEVLVSHEVTPAAPNSTDLAVPLQALTRDVVNGARPPGYAATTRPDEQPSTRPSRPES